jgi:chromosome segregation ATPase
VICRVDGTVHRGRVVVLEAGVDPQTVATAVREGTATDGVVVSVAARTPHRAHERVGCLRSGMGLRVRTALAAAARARGLSTAVDRRLQEARAALEEEVDGTVEGADTRRTVARERSDTDRLRERVAAMRGRLEARRAEGLDTDRVRERLREAARELSEAETAAAAAEQTLDRQRRHARRTRDELERRLTLEDEVANLERQARARLVERVREAYTGALADVPGGPETVPENPFDVETLSAALSVARVAAFDTPVVVACDRFEDPAAASRWLGAPVIEL